MKKRISCGTNLTHGLTSDVAAHFLPAPDVGPYIFFSPERYGYGDFVIMRQYR